MSSQPVASTTILPPLIPDPSLVRARLSRLRVEARLLARLLRIAEDRIRVLPSAEKEVTRV